MGSSALLALRFFVWALLWVLSRTSFSAYITFPAPDGVTLSAILYTPEGYNLYARASHSGMVLMHGCSGMWSNRKVNATRAGEWRLQNHIRKWASKLVSEGIVVLVVDSFTPRAPSELRTSEDWQNQCASGNYPSAVSSYTTRVEDARAAWRYLVSMGTVEPRRIGLLGWSHGAQAVMTEAAEAYRDRDEPRTDFLFAVLVGFYPGCGDHLGFGGVDASFWRPYMDFVLNVGQDDEFWPNCSSRVDLARRDYPDVTLSFPLFKFARHSFDHSSQKWPADKCLESLTHDNADACAMKNADIDSLAFLLDYLGRTRCQDGFRQASIC